MIELINQLQEITDKKVTHYFGCKQCQNAHIDIDNNDYCEDYKALKFEYDTVQMQIEAYQIDID